MRITNKYLHLMSVFPALTETFVLREVQQLSNLGWDATICQLRPTRNDPLAAGFESLNGCVVYADIITAETLIGFFYCCYCHPRLTWDYFRLALSAVSEPKKLAKIAYVLIVSMSLSYKFRHADLSHIRAHHLHNEALAAMFIAGFLGIPYSFTAHTVKTEYQRCVLNRIVMGAEFIVAISDQVRTFLYSFRVDVSRVKLIRNSVRLSDFHLRNMQVVGGTPLVLGIGRLDYKKGFHVLLRACDRLRRRGVPFRCVIIGDGAERRNLLRLRAELQLTEAVDMVGRLAFSEVSTWLDRSTILAVPSVVGPDGATDGLPTVIIEAFAKGVPVVGTRTAAIPEIVKNGLTGYLVPPDSPEQLALCIGELLERRELRDQFSIEARRLVEREYDMEGNGRVLAMLMSAHTLKE
jgi:glycosyltransferase involved in cell wall biosynthesis